MCSNCNYPGFFFKTSQGTQYMPLKDGINCVSAKFNDIYLVNNNNLLIKFNQDKIEWQKQINYPVNHIEICSEYIYVFCQQFIYCFFLLNGQLVKEFNFNCNMVKKIGKNIFISIENFNNIYKINHYQIDEIIRDVSVIKLVDFIVLNNQVYFLYKNFNNFTIVSQDFSYQVKAQVEKGGRFLIYDEKLYFYYFQKNNLYISNFDNNFIIKGVLQILKIFDNQIVIIEMIDGSLRELTKSNKSNWNSPTFCSFELDI